MNVFDYLNSKRGGDYLARYSAVAFIAVFLVLSVIMCWKGGWKSFPEGFISIGGMILAAALGHAFIEKRAPEQAPTQPNYTPQP